MGPHVSLGGDTMIALVTTFLPFIVVDFRVLCFSHSKFYDRCRGSTAHEEEQKKATSLAVLATGLCASNRLYFYSYFRTVFSNFKKKKRITSLKTAIHFIIFIHLKIPTTKMGQGEVDGCSSFFGAVADVPVEVLLAVLERLTIADLTRTEAVCRRWRSFLHDSSTLWRTVPHFFSVIFTNYLI
jgi:hypothetical protein